MCTSLLSVHYPPPPPPHTHTHTSQPTCMMWYACRFTDENEHTPTHSFVLSYIYSVLVNIIYYKRRSFVAFIVIKLSLPHLL